MYSVSAMLALGLLLLFVYLVGFGAYWSGVLLVLFGWCVVAFVLRSLACLGACACARARALVCVARSGVQGAVGVCACATCVCLFVCLFVIAASLLAF